SMKMHPFNTAMLLNIFLVITSIVIPISGLDSRKLDETTDDQGVKCTPSCTQASPPPPPPPSPPPPSPPPPTLCPPPPSPPPPPKKPPTQYCPPPPSPFIYVFGPPGGGLYPLDDDYNGASKNFHVGLPVLLSFGLVGLILAFW
ncbi:hypothetical protein CFOL_v3_05554, partial [Cephalotus follicularis]